MPKKTLQNSNRAFQAVLDAYVKRLPCCCGWDWKHPPKTSAAHLPHCPWCLVQEVLIEACRKAECDWEALRHRKIRVLDAKDLEV
jgi:hypothetical protein